MKRALNEDGLIIWAGASSPKEALCPHCGGRTVLRQRKRMGETKKAYFWRHMDNRNLHCPRRMRPGLG